MKKHSQSHSHRFSVQDESYDLIYIIVKIKIEMLRATTMIDDKIERIQYFEMHLVEFIFFFCRFLSNQLPEVWNFQSFPAQV